jgi:hypothetical protein
MDQITSSDTTPHRYPLGHSSYSTNPTASANTGHRHDSSSSSTFANRGNYPVERNNYSITRFTLDKVNPTPEYKYSKPAESVSAHTGATMSNIEAFDAAYNRA